MAGRARHSGARGEISRTCVVSHYALFFAPAGAIVLLIENSAANPPNLNLTFYVIYTSMASSDNSTKILDAYTARKLRLAYVDGERACTELKKHLVKGEAVLHVLDRTWYFTSGGRVIEVKGDKSKILLEFDGIKIGDKVCTLPRSKFEDIMCAGDSRVIFKKLVAAASIAKDLPEFEPLLGLAEEDAIRMRTAYIDSWHTLPFRQYLEASGESILFSIHPSHISSHSSHVLIQHCSVCFTSKGRAFVVDSASVWKSATVSGITSTMGLCDMPEALVRNIMCIIKKRELMLSLVVAAEAIKAASKQSTGEKRKRVD